jgi:sugar transferase (PEP-CTERM system associated)
MFIPFSRRLALLAALELALAAIILSGAFLLVAPNLQPAVDATVGSAVAAQLIFAVCLLVPAGALGIHRFDRAEAFHSFLGKSAISIGVGLLLCYAAFGFVPTVNEYRGSLPYAALLGAAGLIVVRVLVVPRLSSEALQLRVLILGTAEEAGTVDMALRRLEGRGVRVAGFYQTDAHGPIEVARDRILSRAESLETLVAKLSIQVIVVAVREQRGGALPLGELVNCRLRGVEVTDVPGVLERVTGSVPVEMLKSSWLIFGKGFAQGRTRRAVKRLFDVCMATLLLMVAAPVMLLAAIAILVESGRPIIFRQERVGLAGRTFLLLKFRSMRADAEKDGVPQWASARDPRVTSVGKILRRSRIDELPQLFNVLRGEMSFVGPRPERPFFVSQLSDRIPFYGARHSVKPGVTGWAQVRYPYGASIEDAIRKLELDLYYVKNHSLLLDLLILIKTVKVVLLGEGVR